MSVCVWLGLEYLRFNVGIGGVRLFELVQQIQVLSGFFNL